MRRLACFVPVFVLLPSFPSRFTAPSPPCARRKRRRTRSSSACRATSKPGRSGNSRSRRPCTACELAPGAMLPGYDDETMSLVYVETGSVVLQGKAAARHRAPRRRRRAAHDRGGDGRDRGSGRLLRPAATRRDGDPQREPGARLAPVRGDGSAAPGNHRPGASAGVGSLGERSLGTGWAQRNGVPGAEAEKSLTAPPNYLMGHPAFFRILAGRCNLRRRFNDHRDGRWRPGLRQRFGEERRNLLIGGPPVAQAYQSRSSSSIL